MLLGGGVLVQAQGLIVACAGAVLLALPLLGLVLDQAHAARGIENLLLVRDPNVLLAVPLLSMTRAASPALPGGVEAEAPRHPAKANCSSIRRAPVRRHPVPADTPPLSTLPPTPLTGVPETSPGSFSSPPRVSIGPPPAGPPPFSVPTPPLFVLPPRTEQLPPPAVPDPRRSRWPWRASRCWCCSSGALLLRAALAPAFLSPPPSRRP